MSISKNRTIAIVFTVIVAGAAALAWFILSPKPEDILLAAQRNLAASDRLRYELEFEVDGGWDRPELRLGGGDVLLAGAQTTDLDRGDRDLPASRTEFSYRLEAGGEEAVIAGEARRKDGVHYLRLDEGSTDLFEGVSALEERWVMSADPFLSFIIETEDGPEKHPLSEEGIAELEIAFGAVPIFRFIEKLDDAEIGGEKTHRYRVAANGDVVAALLLRRWGLQTGVEARPEDFALLRARVASWGEPEGEVFIGKKDRRFRRVTLTSKLPTEFGGADLRVAVALGRYGGSIEVEAPNADPVEDVLGPVLFGRLSLAGDRVLSVQETPSGSSLPAAPSSAGSDQPKDSDGDGLADTQEFFYGSDAWNPDTDADGWQDGHEVANGMNPIGPGTLFGFGL